MRENLIRGKEGIFGDASLHKHNSQNRTRSYSAPACIWEAEDYIDDHFDSNDRDAVAAASSSEFVSPYSTEQDLARPKYEKSPALANQRKVMFQGPSRQTSPSGRQFQCDIDSPPPAPRSNRKEQRKKRLLSLLEKLLCQQSLSGDGISQAVLSELAITLWMMMEVGQAWTAMALNLLASDRDAVELVQYEIDVLVSDFGIDELYSPSVLKRMKYMDALIYEAIRLCPAFLGGLKQTTRTIEFEDIGIQLAKNTHIFFCQPTNLNFDIRAAFGRQPENLGDSFPCLEL